MVFELSGLDVVSADALTLPGHYYDVPPVICYLDRGVETLSDAHEHACQAVVKSGRGDTRAARTDDWQRYRLFTDYEVGHQAAALLNLANSLRPILQGMQRGSGSHTPSGRYGSGGFLKSWLTFGRFPYRHRFYPGPHGRCQLAACLRVSLESG